MESKQSMTSGILSKPLTRWPYVCVLCVPWEARAAYCICCALGYMTQTEEMLLRMEQLPRFHIAGQLFLPQKCTVGIFQHFPLVAPGLIWPYLQYQSFFCQLLPHTHLVLFGSIFEEYFVDSRVLTPDTFYAISCWIGKKMNT